MGTKKKKNAAFYLAAALIAAVACATSPKGRKQLILVPESQMDSMGAQAFTQLRSQTPEEADASVKAYVACVTEPITEVVNRDHGNRDWEVVVFKDDQANAFALPGGKIGVYTGLLKVAKTPGQLAAVIGHEVGHVIARHGNERVSDTLVAQVGLAGVTAIAGNQSNPRYGQLVALLGVPVVAGAYLLPHSRTQESEADAIGLDLMAKAGFNPEEAVALWKNMGEAGKSEPPEFLSTHPSHATRIRDIEKNLPAVRPYYTRTQSHPVCRGDKKTAGF